jgi:hypothetical protein
MTRHAETQPFLILATFLLPIITTLGAYAYVNTVAMIFTAVWWTILGWLIVRQN